MLPRPVHKNRTYLITRRCAGRRYLLKPSPLVTQVVTYCVAVAASLYGVKVHAVVVMSTHIHLVVTDPNAWVPKFMHWLDMMVARFLNAKFGRTENFWSNGTYNRPEIIDPEDVLRKMIYVLVNPVAAGAEPVAARWRGLWTGTLRDGVAHFTAAKPKLGTFFEEHPDEVTLVVERPAGFEHLSGKEFSDLFQREFEKGEAAARERVVAEHEASGRGGQPFEGTRAVLARSREDRATSLEEFASLDPNVIASDKALRIQMIEDLKTFRAEYRDALRRFQTGEDDVEFPPGTYWMRLHMKVRVRAPP